MRERGEEVSGGEDEKVRGEDEGVRWEGELDSLFNEQLQTAKPRTIWITSINQ